VTGPAAPPTGEPEHVDRLWAPAKLTLSLRITGVRPDGYHLIESDMATIDLADTLTLSRGDRLTVSTDEGPLGRARAAGWPSLPIPTGPDNLVRRALAATGRKAAVHLVKRVPPGAGLGGGSADAAAVLRWAGRTDPDLAARLGADVPFCVRGGRARVSGIGERLEPLPYVDRSFILMLLPFGVSTVAVYRAWDDLVDRGVVALPWPPAGGSRLRATVSDPAGDPGPVGQRDDPGGAPEGDAGVNDLEAPALEVEPRLKPWRTVLSEATGRRPRMAGSGSTFFVEGTPESCGLGERRTLTLGGETALLVPVRTTPPITGR
jgi:4-diphosphocytidyl-2-C-methyl-D-erythritol kinase